jgi:tRNA(His) guanylyltransferase
MKGVIFIGLQASAKFSLLLSDMGVFDSRISQLPSKNLVVDYFRWRTEDAHRNALNAHCYWKLREENIEPEKVSKQLSGASVSDKNELLFQRGVNFNDIPTWQKRGVGIYWEEYEKNAVNKKTGKPVTALRRGLKTDYNLPMKDQYDEFISRIIPNFS